MFFWNSRDFSMIQRKLAIWSLFPPPSLKTSLNIWKFTAHILLKPGLENFKHSPCNFLSQSKNLKWWMDQCYSSVLLASKGKYILEVWGWSNPKYEKRKARASILLLSLFSFFPLSLPCVNSATQEGCLFYLRSSLLWLVYFRRLFPSLSFSHRHFGLLFPILTT